MARNPLSLWLTVAALAVAAAPGWAQTPLPVREKSAPAAPRLSAPAATEAQAPEKEWTITAYLNGKNDLSDDALWALNELEKAGPSARVNVVAELGQIINDRGQRTDSSWTGARRYLLAKDAGEQIASAPLPGYPRADMGSPRHFSRFLKWSKKTFPAKKHMLVLKNHGQGVLGISEDHRSKRRMDVPGFARAIKDAGGVDLLILDACLMQTAETLYELRGAAPLVTASEEYMISQAFKYRRIQAALNRNPGMRPETAGKKFVDEFHDFSPTVSLMRTSALEGFCARLDAWTAAVMSSPGGKGAAALAAQNVQRMGEDGLHADLMHFVRLVNKAAKDPELERTSLELASFYIDNVLSSNKTSDFMISNAHGLSIYLPPDGEIAPEYAKLAFARDTSWPRFLQWLKDNGAVRGPQAQ